MSITAIGLILIVTVIACSVHSSVAAVFGDACTDNSNCTETGQVCNNTCVCYTDNDYTRVGNKCVKELGTDCTIAANCNDVNVICDNSNCQCKDTHYDDNGDTSLGGSCIAKHALGESCTNPAVAPNTVQCSDANAVCKAESGGTGYTCQLTWNDWGGWTSCSVTCGAGTRSRTRSCPSDGSCSGNNAENEDCNEGNCPVAVDGGWSTWTVSGDCSVTCGGGTQTTSRSCTNPAPQYGGEQCSGDASGTQDCSTQNCPVDGGWSTWTVSGACSVTCGGGTQTRSRSCTNPSPQYGGLQCSGSGSGSQQCNTDNCPVISFGQPCRIGGDKCEGPKTECRSSTCQCVSGYYWNGNNCVIKVDLGYNCPMPNACSSSWAECVGSRCRCTNTYYDTNTDNTMGGSCETRRSLGATCSNIHSNSKQCVDENASCRGSFYTCSCDDRYHQDGSSCKPNIALGGNCKGVLNECSDPNAKCINSKCTCSVGFYWFNKGSSQSNCRRVEELQVTGITFTKIETTEFTVSWTASSRSSYVSGYDVEWQSNGKVVGATSPQRITGLIPGKTYVVKVISKDTATEPGDTRTNYTSKQQAAKPSIPGPVTSTENDLDASDGNIDIKWTAGTGVITLYRVKLFDGDTQKGPRDASFESTTFNNVLNGYRYNVSVTARSQQFNGDYLWSETKVSTIKTKVQVPQAPRNAVCKSSTDSAITLNWNAPSLPNGDLVRYHIDVMDTSFKVLFRNITTETETKKVVGNLQPGTNYIFRLYTENERYNSTNYAQVSSACKTRAKMSDPPTTLALTEVTSRGFSISWEKPGNTFSEENYGYDLQIKDETSFCVKEVIYRCSDCSSSFILSNLTNLCDPTKRDPIIDKTKQELASKLTYTAVLNPDIVYTVSVTAINDAGRGHPATDTQRTNEEAPQKPYQVSVTDINSTSFWVNWEIGSPRPGNTTYTIKAMTDIAQSKEFNVIGYENRNYLVTGLEEFWNYNVTVTASTSIGPNTSDVSDTYQTLPAAPGKVHDFRKHDAPNGDYLKLKITWKAPVILERNSIIKKYKYEHNASEELESPDALSQKENEGYEYNVMLNVVPEEYYSFEVYAVNEQDRNGKPIHEVIKTKAGVPINIEKTQNVDVVEGPKESSQQRQFTVTFAEDFFNQRTNGAIRATGFVVCKDSKCDSKDSMSLSDFNTLDAWSVGLKKGYYRATEADWLKNLKSKTSTPNSRRKREVEVVKQQFIVGSDTCSSNTDSTEYCNGPVDPDTSYIVIAVACTNGGCLISKKYGPFVTAAEPDDTNLGLIIGIVVAAVVIVVLAAVIIVLVLRRRRGRKSDGMKRTHDTDDEDVNFDPATEKIPRKRPINLNEIEEYVANMHKDSNLLFSAEYEELKTLSPKHACEAADREENRMRNRYINIIPFDHSRVKLSTNGEDDSADYINGNYLPGYNSPREYIGCQGPIPGTIDDFWRMTWEQNVSVIVMLTLCKEGQKIKCEQYWPDEVGEPKQYGDVIVEITSYSNIRTYDYRMFRITNGSTTRVVKHFHFLSWLDFQANVHHDIILDFIQHVRQHVQPPDTSGPMIIHCSAGVGRTGTYIALDHLMQFINEHDFDVEIDIFDLVLKLRENRQHMVQTEQQYVFIHDCVKEIMERKRRQMENIYENQGFSQDENIYQNEQSLYANVSISKAEQNTEL